MTNLSQLLDGYSLVALTAIARSMSFQTPPGTTKDGLIDTLTKVVSRPELIKDRVETIEPRDRKVLDRLILRGGSAGTVSFRKEVHRLGLVTTDKLPQGKNWLDMRVLGSFDEVVGRLTKACLVFSWESAARTKIDLKEPGSTLVIPPEILKHLPRPSAKLPDPEVISVAAVREASVATLQRDVYLYWRFLNHNPVTLTSRLLVPKRQLAKIVDSLTVSENLTDVSSEEQLGRTYFLRRLIEDLDLVKAEGLDLVPQPAISQFLAKPAAQRTRKAFVAWVSSDQWNELLHLPRLTIEPAAYRERTPDLVLTAREFVVSLLAELPAEQWISLRHLIERAKTINYEFLISRDTLRTYHYGRYETNPYEAEGNKLGWTFAGLKDDEHGWEMVEGGFIATVLREPLHWLGLVSLGYNDGALAAFRISELGARIVRGEALPEDTTPPGKVIIQPNFQIFAFDPVSEDILHGLDRVADLVKADQAVEYRLTRESAYRGQQAQLSVASIVGFLERVSGKPLPQNVRRTLEEWGSQHERIVFTLGVGLLHSDDSQQLDLLFRNGELAQQLGRRLTPTAALVPKGADGLKELFHALLKKGQLPAVHDAEVLQERQRIEISPEGRVVFEHGLPNIYIWQQAATFTEEREGSLWLTPRSVQRATQEGLSAEDIIVRLGELQRASVPPVLADRIKAWAKHWGTVSVESMTVVRVKDQTVLDELLQDAQVGRWIKPYRPEGVFATVDAGSVAALRAALATKGIELQEAATIAVPPSDNFGPSGDGGGITRGNGTPIQHTVSHGNGKASETEARAAVQGQDYEIVASRTTKIFCRASCGQAKRIRAQNKVAFDSREQAAVAGYRPCKICEP